MKRETLLKTALAVCIALTSLMAMPGCFWEHDEHRDYRDHREEHHEDHHDEHHDEGGRH